MSTTTEGSSPPAEPPTSVPGSVGKKLELEVAKLRLEIADLSRSPWAKPSVIIPIVAALTTLALSQYLGVFDVERKRVEISTKEMELKRTKLQDDLAILRSTRDALLQQKAALDERKTGLGREVARLTADEQSLSAQVISLKTQTDKSQKEAAAARLEVDRTKKVLARPGLDVVRKVLVVEQDARLVVANRGRGPAILKRINMYVDDRLMPAGTERGPYAPTLTALFGPIATWIRWHDAEGTVDSGIEREIIMIEPGQFTQDRAALFYTATDRLGFELCYCSKFGDCYWSTYHRPTPSEPCG